MAAASIRTSWTGQIEAGPVAIDVVAKPVTGPTPGATALKRLCSCHEQPFSQSNSCPGGKSPLSAAAIKRGDTDLTEVVYGVEADDGTYVLLDADVIDEIEESVVLPSVQIEEVVPRATATEPTGFPLHLGVTSYYIAHDKDGAPEASYDLAALHCALAATGNVAVAKWSQRGPQKLVGIHAVGDVLMMTVVPFAATVREPDALVMAHSSVKVDAGDVDAFAGFLTGMTSTTFDHDVYEDEATPKREQAIDAALKAAKKGKKVAVKKQAAKPAPRGKGSLAERLAAAGKASPAKGKKAAPKTVRAGRR